VTASARLTRKERQARTRECLLAAAARVLARGGLQRATIDEVAAEAGFTKGAFYANFSGKEELFLAMLEQRFAERLGQIERLSDGDAEVEERARVAGEDFGRYVRADPEWQRLFFEFVVHATREEGFRAELVRRYRDLRGGIAKVVEEQAAQLGSTLPLAPAELAMMIFAMANGFALERLLEPEDASDELYGSMLMIFAAGVRALAQEEGDAPRTHR
jgi:AcrR family transcriptional regulator